MNQNSQLPDTPQKISPQNADSLSIRIATEDDIPTLAALNMQLIHDEGSRNPMSVPQLENRINEWLKVDYQAVLIYVNNINIGYALYRFDPEYTYLRQFYIRPEYRRHGFGRAAIKWLMNNTWANSARIRLEVLINNEGGIQFWRALGFLDYCLTLEKEVIKQEKRDYLR